MTTRFIFIILFTIANRLLFAQSDRIILDENFDDWQNIAPIISDPFGDNGNSFIDFGKLWISNDEDFIFFRLEVGLDINLQNNNEITVYIDADNNINTGLETDGIGADLVYNFGNRVGGIYQNNNNILVNHEDIRLFTSPTVTSDVFEIAIGRHLTFWGEPVFQGNEVKVLFKNNSGNGDHLPDENGGLSYSFSNNIATPLPGFSLYRSETAPLRIMSYNVLFDQLFDNEVQQNYQRIFAALDPDLIGLQEVYDHSAQQTANKIADWLPLNSGGQWHSAKIEPDIVVISKYPIISSHLIGTSLFSNNGNGAFLIDLDPASGTKLLFVVAHPPCCNNEDERQKELDALMAFIRDAKVGAGPVQLAPNDPIVVTGDMNLVGLRQQQFTLINGDIVNENNYGADFNPDWDETSFEDAKPLATHLPLTMTWYDEGSSYSPGRLDYLVYSGSVLTMENAFALFTPALSPTELIEHGLQSNDVLLASDHLPLVGDFAIDFTNSTTSDLVYSEEDKMVISPNPFSFESRINITLSQKSAVEIILLDINGRLCQVIHRGELKSGQHHFDLNSIEQRSGVYICQMKTINGIISQKIVVY